MSESPVAALKHRVPSVVPLSLRKQLYAWHPGRARRWHQVPGVEHVGGQQIVLTFDDGPAHDATPRVLDELAKAGVRATFFLLGRQVLREPKLAEQIVSAAHEVALHGNDHIRLDKVHRDVARMELEAGLQAIVDVTGQTPRWFRPPFGRLSKEAGEVCSELGLGIAYWSASGLDWEDIGASEVEAEVCTGLTPGAIVLLHDTARFGRRESAAATALAINAIVQRGRARGLSWRTLSEAAPSLPEATPSLPEATH